MREQKDRTVAIILAGGKGSRMNSSVPKQYMELAGKPLLWHTLRAFSDSEIDSIILVVGKGEEERCRREILVPFHFVKVIAVVEGGQERYDSVGQGLAAWKEGADLLGDIVLIHDAARACISPETIHEVIEGARQYGACIPAVPVKDTVKLSEDGSVVSKTLPRSQLWAVQTPQGFQKQVILEAYRKMEELRKETPDVFAGLSITDDASVVETFLEQKVWIVPGKYSNIKVTTPEDMEIAEKWVRIAGGREKKENEEPFNT